MDDALTIAKEKELAGETRWLVRVSCNNEWANEPAELAHRIVRYAVIDGGSSTQACDRAVWKLMDALQQSALADIKAEAFNALTVPEGILGDLDG